MSNKDIDVLVVGSIFMDLICYAEKLPAPGETISGTDFKTGFGGKGANQAVAAARVGSKTAFIGKLGEDTNGHAYFDNLKLEGIDVSCIKFEKDVPTGVASIMVGEDNGENMIVIVRGATGLMDDSYVETKECEDMISNSKIIVTQLEVPLKSTLKALELGKKHGCTTILNAAPGVENLPKQFFTLADILCINETEAQIITGVPNVQDSSEAQEAVKTLTSDFDSNHVIITLGPLGALLWDNNVKKFDFFTPPKLNGPVVDTTGAGDCFVGVLAHCLAKNYNISDAVSQAVKNSSESVLKKGTQSSYPHKLIL